MVDSRSRSGSRPGSRPNSRQGAARPKDRKSVVSIAAADGERRASAAAAGEKRASVAKSEGKRASLNGEPASPMSAVSQGTQGSDMSGAKPRGSLPAQPVAEMKTNQFLDWMPEDLVQQEVDQEATAKRTQVRALKRNAREQLLSGKSESFKQQFFTRNPIIDEDVTIYRRTVDGLSDEIAAMMRQRKRVTVVVYGHEEVDRQGAAKCISDSCLNSLRTTINRAALQHEMKLENEKKMEERARQQSMIEARNSLVKRASMVMSPNSTASDSDRPGTAEKGGRKSLVGRSAMRSSVSGAGINALPRDRTASRKVSVIGSDSGSPRAASPRNKSRKGSAMSATERLTTQGRKSVVQINPLPMPDLEPVKGDTLTQRVLPPLDEVSSPPATGSTVDKPLSRNASRKASVRSLRSVGSVASGIVRLSGNGRKGGLSCLNFDGHTTYVKLQPLKGLSDWIHLAEIEFWMKCSEHAPMVLLWVADKSTSVATLRVHLNMNSNGEAQSDVLGVYIRDQNSNTFAAYANTVVLDGEWHHVRIRMRNLAENLVDIYVDGRIRQAYVTIAECPTKFSNWDQVALIGAQYRGMVYTHTPENAKTELEYQGLIMDMKVTCHEEKSTLRHHWPLIDASSEDLLAVATDICGGPPGDIVFPNWIYQEFPSTFLWFNGEYTHINFGTLGNFGVEMGACKIEFWMKCECKTRSMAVFKVTDSTAKQAQLGMELNKNAEGAYEKGTTLFTLRDTAGARLVATQSGHDLCDGRWHEMSWVIKCADNTFQVRVDGYNLELDYAHREKPEQFLPFTQWFCLGAHNNRGVVSNHFEGVLVRFRIMSRDGISADDSAAMGLGCIGKWPLDEGTGCTVAMDKTGNGHNGIIYNNKSRKKASLWLLLEAPEGYTPEEDWEAVLATDEDTFETNNVDISYVTITQRQDDSGLYREVLLDNLADKAEVRPEEVDMFRTLDWMPKSCYKKCQRYTDTTAIVEAHCAEKLSPYESSMLSLSIGEGQLNIFQLRGFCHREKAVWNPEMDEWVDPLMLMTQHDKRVNFVNKRAMVAEKALRQYGQSPLLARKAHAPLDDYFVPDSIAARLLKTSLTGEDNSYMVFVYLKRSTEAQTVQEVDAARWFVEQQIESTRHHAAIVIQKRVRILLAISNRLLKQKAWEEIVRQRDYKKRLRTEQPDAVSYRARRVALIINCTDSQDKRIPAHDTARTRCLDLEEFLKSQGWEVTVLSEGKATRARITTELAKLTALAEEKTALTFLHVIAYATRAGRYFAFPTRKSIGNLLVDQEGPQRIKEYAQEQLEREQISGGFKDELQELLEAVPPESAEEKKRREIEEARVRRKSLAAEREKSKPKKWSISTRVVKKDSESPLSPEEAQEMAARKESLLRATTPLPFEPSPTPELDLCEERPIDTRMHSFILAADTPIEYSADNTLPFDVFDSFVKVKVGYHAISSGEFYTPPNVTGDQQWGYLSSSNSQRIVWKRRIDFFSLYLLGALRAASTSDLRKLLKPRDLAEKDAALEKEMEDADHEDRYLIKRKISSTIGVTWEDVYGHVIAEMERCKAEVETQQPKVDYVGDMVLISNHVPDLITRSKRSRVQLCTAMTTVTIADPSMFDAKDLEDKMRNEVLNALHVAYDQAVKPRRLPASNPIFRLAFPHKVSQTSAPFTNPEDWADFFSRLTHGKPDAIEWRLEIPAGQDSGFVVIMEVTHTDANVRNEIVENLSILFRAKVPKDCGLVSLSLPAKEPLMPECERCFTFAAHAERHLIHKILEAGDVATVVEEKATLPLKVHAFRMAGEVEHKLVDKLHQEELKRQRDDAAYRRANPTGDAARRLEIERKRKSLSKLR